MGRRSTLALVLLLLALAAGATGATAATSLADEVAPGQALSARLQAGQVTCAQLASDDFDHLGEYVMNRMVGSLARHEALNARMTAVMGADNEARMHVLMGQRYSGCLGTGTSGAGAMGSGMMGGGGWGDSGAWSQMRGSDTWSWMSDGSWQQMSHADWQRLSEQWIGPGMMSARGGWSATDTALVGGAALIAAGLVAGGLLMWRARRGGGPEAPTGPRSSAT